MKLNYDINVDVNLKLSKSKAILTSWKKIYNCKLFNNFDVNVNLVLYFLHKTISQLFSKFIKINLPELMFTVKSRITTVTYEFYL